LAAGGFFFAFCFSPAPVMAATNMTNLMSPSTSWGWNSVIGWINFNTYNDVTVSANNMVGFASSSAGPISLDCGTPGICSSQNGNYTVQNASGTAEGNLSGWAWNDKIGWITFFWGNASSSPVSSSTFNYACKHYSGPYCGVSIDSYGNFNGAAWNDLVGWIFFNHTDPYGGWNFTSNFEAQTTWAPVAETGVLDSATFDTGSPSGTELNSIMWQGSLNGCLPGSVGFKFAVATSSAGPWNFGSTVYSGNPNTPISISNYTAYSGYRYFRYETILTTNASQSCTPIVGSISVDWSP